MKSKTLYAKDNKGQIRTWTVEELSDGLLITHGVIGGAQQEKFESVPEGLATRSLSEQVTSRANSRINKKLDAGYCESIEEAQNKPRTNALGFQKPMLAAKFDTVKNIDYDRLYVQHKYDGNRMLIVNQDGQNMAYTRNGKLIETIPEIIQNMNIPEGHTVDGEIYCHGESLQTIVSWVKRRQENSLKLRFHAYDIMVDEEYEERLNMLKDISWGEFGSVVPTTKYDGHSSIKELLASSINRGYEGLILRQNDYGYEAGKRSKSLVKVKQFFDDEFKITGMHLSKDGIPMINFVTDEGVNGKVVAPGSMFEKQMLWNDVENVVGKWVHLEYSQLTKDRVPFHPTATAILDSKSQLK